MSDTHLTDAEDPSGLITLERLSEARKFNKWLFETISPYCKGHVLEVGSGIGNITEMFLQQSFKVTASDLRKEYTDYLTGKLQQYPNFQSALILDLETETIPAELENQFDSIVALNVVEHIANAPKAINNCRKMLQPGGHMVVLVPAMQSLYNNFDKELGHHLRYSSDTLKALLENQGLPVIHTEYFNTMGMLGWWLNGSLLNKKLIPGKQLQLFNQFVPLFKVIDKITFHSIGLSVIAVGKK